MLSRIGRLLVISILCACRQPAQNKPASSYADVVAGVGFNIPEAWRSVPPKSSMRAREYRVEEDGELAVFFFGPGQGGTESQNLTRWTAQFTAAGGKTSPAQTDVFKAAGLEITTAYIEGTYAADMPAMGPQKAQPGHAMLGAIVKGPQGLVFFKLLGPKATILKNRTLFESFARGMGAGQRTPP
ncbi:MAG: hypothetical protein HY611_04970 [Elusimicrobia bacterium]|nr:hypothetical protein [Elusimicrobiota bacterium]